MTRKEIRDVAAKITSKYVDKIVYAADGKQNLKNTVAIINLSQQKFDLFSQAPKTYEVESILEIELITWEKKNVLDELDLIAIKINEDMLNNHFDIKEIITDVNNTAENKLGILKMIYEYKHRTQNANII